LSKKALYCNECLTILEDNARLKDENKKLKFQIFKRDRQTEDGFFGSSTPSSQKPFKANNTTEIPKNIGGAKLGHTGNSRQTFSECEADQIENIDSLTSCPCCGEELSDNGSKDRNVIDLDPVVKRKIIYRLKGKYCKKCRRSYTSKTNKVLPKFLYGNKAVAYLSVEHYLNGLTLGSLETRTSIGIGSIINIFHKLASIFKKIPDDLIKQYREELVKHADETSWHYDGKHSYVWLFCSPFTSIYKFAKTRSATVVDEVLGKDKLPGVLVVDRYQGYNKAPVDLQYCYAHLLRKVEDASKDFPDEKEVVTFVNFFAPMLAEAMSLRRQDCSDDEFKEQAELLKTNIMKAAKAEAQHPAVIEIQDIFTKMEHRLFLWTTSKDIPADNNFAERSVRSLVIARKVSFGSHSDEGAKTREILMTLLYTLKKRSEDPMGDFVKILENIADKPDREISLDDIFGKSPN